MVPWTGVLVKPRCSQRRQGSAGVSVVRRVLVPLPGDCEWTVAQGCRLLLEHPNLPGAVLSSPVSLHPSAETSMVPHPHATCGGSTQTGAFVGPFSAFGPQKLVICVNADEFI